MSRDAKRIARRFSLPAPRLEGRNWPDISRQLQDWLAIATSIFDGLGTGGDQGGLSGLLSTIVPADVEAGLPGDVGVEPLGAARGDHRHAILTAAAVALTPASTNTEGAGAALARATHTHDMSAMSSSVDTQGDIMSKVSLGF